MTDDDTMDQQLRRWGAEARTAAPPVSIPDVTASPRCARTTWLTVAAAVVAVALIAAVVGITSSRSDNQAGGPTTAATNAVTPATAPGGARAVVFHGLAVNVPSDWSDGKARCGVPTENTVLLDGPVDACSVGEIPAVSSVSFRQFAGGLVPALPDACCDVSGTNTTAPTPSGQPFAVGDAPATLYRSEPSPEEPFFTSTITVESHRAAIIVRSPAAATVDDIVSSLHLEQADPNGCVSFTEHANFFPSDTHSPDTTERSSEPTIPQDPQSVTVCRYVGGWIEQSSTLATADATNLISLINGAPEGTSGSDSGMGTCQPPSTGADSTSTFENEGFTITATYTDREPLTVTAQISCGPFGVSAGSATRQMTSDIASALVAAAGASQGWPMNFSPTP